MRSAKETKPKAKSKPKTGPAAVSHEKELKTLIGQDLMNQNELKAITDECEKDKDAWTWAVDWAKRLHELTDKIEVAKAERGGFMADFELAMMVPASQKALKKKHGDEFEPMIIRAKDALKPLVDEFTTTMNKVILHAKAADLYGGAAKKRQKRSN
jgi:hypothetical protein